MTTPDQDASQRMVRRAIIALTLTAVAAFVVVGGAASIVAAFGKILLVKLGLVITTVSVGSLIRRCLHNRPAAPVEDLPSTIGPGTATAFPRRPASEVPALSIRELRLRVAAELGGGMAILTVTTVLLATPLP